MNFNYDFVNNYIQGMEKESAVLITKLNDLQNKIKADSELIKQKENEQAQLQMIVSLFNKASTISRDQCKKTIEDIVTNALQYITERTNIRFIIELNDEKISANCYVEVDNGIEKSKQDIFEDSAGGYRDIISFSLRIAYLILYNHPRLNKVLLLDEPGRQISENASIKFAEFLKIINKTYGVQIIMVTHNNNLKSVADESIYVTLDQSKNTSNIVIS